MRSRSWIRYKWNTYNDADGGIFTGGRYSICASDNTSGVLQNQLCFSSHNILERDFSRFCIYYKVEIHCILTSQRKGERDRSSVQVAGLDCSSREWSNHSFKTDHQTKLSFLVSFFWKSNWVDPPSMDGKGFFESGLMAVIARSLSRIAIR